MKFCSRILNNYNFIFLFHVGLECQYVVGKFSTTIGVAIINIWQFKDMLKGDERIISTNSSSFRFVEEEIENENPQKQVIKESRERRDRGCFI